METKKDIFYKGKIFIGCEKDMPDEKMWNPMSEWEHYIWELPNYEVVGKNDWVNGQEVTGLCKLQHQYRGVHKDDWRDCTEKFYGHVNELYRRTVAIPVQQTEGIEINNKITVEIMFDERIPEEERYCASIKEGIYKGTVVTGNSISDCFKELSVSMFVMDDYKSKNK